MKNKKISAVIFAALTVAITAFIFSNSLQSGEISGNQSDFFVNAVNKLLGIFGVSADAYILGVIIRKLAHFCEYFALSLVSSLFIAYFNKKALYAVAPIYCLIIAVCDEFIMQRITEGRAPMWTDVLIDISGALIAFAWIYCIKNKKQKV